MKALIIEDEAPARNRLRSLLAEVKEELEICCEADSVESAIDYLSSGTPDIILTDIQLGDGTCFDIFNVITPACPVIFITAYDEHALAAFRLNTVDYLLKPLKKEELQRAFEKLRNLRGNPVSIDYAALAKAVLEEEQRKERRYLIRYGEHIRTISSNDIAYIYTISKAVFFVLHSGKEYPADKSLEMLEHELDPRKFFRINRQFIVSISSIGSMSPASKSRVQIELKPPHSNGDVIVSTEKSPQFKIWLGRI
jgi:DNA-binding LytR/AlgR family response regulator